MLRVFICKDLGKRILECMRLVLMFHVVSLQWFKFLKSLKRFPWCSSAIFHSEHLTKEVKVMVIINKSSNLVANHFQVCEVFLKMLCFLTPPLDFPTVSAGLVVAYRGLATLWLLRLFYLSVFIYDGPPKLYG